MEQTKPPKPESPKFLSQPKCFVLIIQPKFLVLFGKNQLPAKLSTQPKKTQKKPTQSKYLPKKINHPSPFERTNN